MYASSVRYYITICKIIFLSTIIHTVHCNNDMQILVLLFHLKKQ